MSEPGIAAAERRAMVKLLKFALKGEATVSLDGARLCLANTAGRQHADPALVARAGRLGLLRGGAGGWPATLAATSETRAFLRRALAEIAEDGFQEQHRDMEAATIEEEGGARITVRRNLAESPLSGLSRLRQKTGDAYFPAEAIEAGERLAADFHRAGLQPRITASWEPRLSSRAPGAAVGARDVADSAAAARRRVHLAIDAMGPELSGVAVDVCCFEKGLETVERERLWPARSAKLLLRAALLALARHYAPPQPPARPRSRHWGAEDFRPEWG